MYLLRKTNEFQQAAMSMKTSRSLRKRPSFFAAAGALLNHFVGKDRKMNIPNHTLLEQQLIENESENFTPFQTQGEKLLYKVDVIEMYFRILVNPNSSPQLQEAVLGIIQNLSACDWSPSVILRRRIRQMGGLKHLLAALRARPIEERVWRSLATTFRNLCLDEENKKIIASVAIPLLLQPMPCVTLARKTKASDVFRGALKNGFDTSHRAVLPFKLVVTR
ncbi:hypothetical protein Ciccas_000890 [Cichlidogyrus casuarinus]|uniref:Uncharacterized protein n=1 Tax=Cichlidogyrus casuarinus TaxID=1844966 RepID=A0ABD2QLL9_9PLAT